MDKVETESGDWGWIFGYTESATLPGERDAARFKWRQAGFKEGSMGR